MIRPTTSPGSNHEGDSVTYNAHRISPSGLYWAAPAAARLVIGPVFIHGIASRTLAGIKAYVEHELSRRPGAPLPR